MSHCPGVIVSWCLGVPILRCPSVPFTGGDGDTYMGERGNTGMEKCTILKHGHTHKMFLGIQAKTMLVCVLTSRVKNATFDFCGCLDSCLLTLLTDGLGAHPQSHQTNEHTQK